MEIMEIMKSAETKGAEVVEKTFDPNLERENIMNFISRKLDEANRPQEKEFIREFMKNIPDTSLEEGIKVYFGPMSRDEVLEAYDRNLLAVKKDLIVGVTKADEFGRQKNKKLVIKIRLLDRNNFNKRLENFFPNVLHVEVEGGLPKEVNDFCWEHLEKDQRIVFVPLIWRKFYARGKRTNAEGVKVNDNAFIMFDEGRIWLSCRDWWNEIPVTVGKKFFEGGRCIRSTLWFKAFTETTTLDNIKL